MHHHASQNLQVWHICLGTAMGNPPAQLYFLIHELNFVHTYPQLCHYVRYLDDIFLIWNPDPNPIKDESDWAKFQRCINAFRDLCWNFDNMRDASPSWILRSDWIPQVYCQQKSMKGTQRLPILTATFEPLSGSP